MISAGWTLAGYILGTKMRVTDRGARWHCLETVNFPPFKSNQQSDFENKLLNKLTYSVCVYCLHKKIILLKSKFWDLIVYLNSIAQ